MTFKRIGNFFININNILHVEVTHHRPILKLKTDKPYKAIISYNAPDISGNMMIFNSKLYSNEFYYDTEQEAIDFAESLGVKSK